MYYNVEILPENFYIEENLYLIEINDYLLIIIYKFYLNQINCVYINNFRNLDGNTIQLTQLKIIYYK